MTNFEMEKTSLEYAQKHVLFHHNESDGWITLAKKNPHGKWLQYHYCPKILAEKLSHWLGEDVYFSQNTFYKPQRRLENIRQLRALYVDVDCYHKGLDPSWVAGKIECELFEENILPAPNIMIFSGQGLVLIWLIDPVPYQALSLWQAVQNYFFEKLKYVGADAKSKDATRVFRIAGSVNSKNGQIVKVHYQHNIRYTLRYLQEEYLPELTEKKTKKPGRKKQVVHLHSIQKLHYERLLDLVKLVELRNYDLKGYRELFCFLYRYWSCCLSHDKADALQQMLDFNSQFIQPLPEREVISATKSAERAWEEKSCKKANAAAIAQGYPGAGYNLKNTTIIEWFDITREEQKHLNAIMDGVEKRRRKRERDRIRITEKRRQLGVMTRQEYLEQQENITDHKLFLLEKALERQSNTTNKELADLLGVSERYVKKLKKNINSNS